MADSAYEKSCEDTVATNDSEEKLFDLHRDVPACAAFVAGITLFIGRIESESKTLADVGSPLPAWTAAVFSVADQLSWFALAVLAAFILYRYSHWFRLS